MGRARRGAANTRFLRFALRVDDPRRAPYKGFECAQAASWMCAPRAHGAAPASFAGIPPVMDVVPPATRSMDHGKGWEGFTNDEMMEGGGCEANECQPVKVLEYTWKKPVTVRSPMAAPASPPVPRHSSEPAVSACMVRARYPPTFCGQGRLGLTPSPTPSAAAQEYDMRARLARLFQQGSGDRLLLPDSDAAQADAVREAALSIYGDLRGPDGPSLERRVHKLVDRISPRVRQAAGAVTGAGVAAVYWRFVKARAQAVRSEWHAEVSALDAVGQRQ